MPGHTLPRVNKCWLFATALLTTLTVGAFSQTSRLGESCDLASQGVQETGTFLAFDQELRGALSKQDTGIIALLVKFPLHINDDRGRYSVDDAASLQARFENVFPTSVRRTVLDQNPKTLFCNDEGVMYGRGTVWIRRTDLGYRIVTINLPVTGRPDQKPIYRVRFACQTEKDRIVVDQPVGLALRYRLWHKPHSVLKESDVEITNGKESVEGTGSCAYPVWTFGDGTSKVEVDGLGCSDEKQSKDAVGSIRFLNDDKPGAFSWCF